jgi:CRP-like cAMP-binding protein
MAWFAADARLRLPAGAAVIREGEPGDAMFVLMQGELSVTVQGKSIDYLLPGSVLGEMAMLDSRSRSATAVAVTDVGRASDRLRFLDDPPAT